MDASTHALYLLLAIVASIALVQTLRLAWRRFAFRARIRRGARGEREAEELLVAHGYEVRDRQARAFLDYAIDGAPCRVEVRADYLVARDGRLWIAEVKTGREAPQLTTPSTRRQLLEYAHAFGGAGVLLVDADRRRVARVALPIVRRSIARPLLIGVAIGAALTLGAVHLWST
jgi:Holliday junction resolvase